MCFLVKAVICPPSTRIREHLTTLWASQVSSHPALQLNIQGSGLHRWQRHLSLAQSLRTSGESSPLPGTKFPPATADLGFHPGPRPRGHKLFLLKPLGSFVQLRHCLFCHFMYLTHKVSLTNAAVQASA